MDTHGQKDVLPGKSLACGFQLVSSSPIVTVVHFNTVSSQQETRLLVGLAAAVVICVVDMFAMP